MPLKKILPKVPDPYINKNNQEQFWPARLGHLDYLIDQINAGGAIPENFTQVYTEQITLSGSDYVGTSGGPLNNLFPANGLSKTFLNEGFFIFPISFVVGMYINTPGSSAFLTKMYIKITDSTGNYPLTSKFDVNNPINNPGASYAVIPIVPLGQTSTPPYTVSITPSTFNVIDQTFSLSHNPGDGGFNFTANDAVKILFSFQAIKKDWFLKNTN